jgi:hypothetical protein
MRMAESDSALLESTLDGDLSLGKETRDFAPFIDQLDIDDLMTGIEELAARLKAAALPQGVIRTPPAAADDGKNGHANDFGPLMKTPLPAAPASSATTDDFEMPPEVEALTIESSMMARGSVAAEKGGVVTGAGGGRAAGSSTAKVQEQEAETAQEDDSERSVIARIEQVAEISEETEISITISQGDEADIEVTADTDIDVVQVARIMIEVNLDAPDADPQPSMAQLPEPAETAAFLPDVGGDSDPTAVHDEPQGHAAPSIAADGSALRDAAEGLLDLEAAPMPSPEPVPMEIEAVPSPIAPPAATPVAAAPAPLIDHDGVSEFTADLDQDIDIDTIVHVDVNGFAGEVIINTQISEHADVRQDVTPTITLTGDEDGFDINISQLLDIDLLSDVDIDIVENGGKLYLTIAVRDQVEGSDRAVVDIADGSDELLDVGLSQSADIDQKLTVSVDLEQELAALFDIDVDVDADLDIAIEQTGDARIGFAPGEEVDVGLDGDSEIDLVNNIHIRIDFTAQ